MTVHTNVYSGEHRVREDVTALLTEHEYEVDAYTITDRGDERLLVVRAKRNRAASQTALRFNTDPGQHPDNV